MAELRSLADRGRFLLVTGFGLGLAPVAPGTFGSLAGVVPAVIIGYAWPARAAVVLWVLAAVLLAFGCAQSRFAERVFERKDPGAFVLDEVVGYLVAAALFMTWQGGLTPMGHGLCFLFFRAFDVCKIQPAKRLEELPGAYGIMLDDVAAGVWAGVALVIAGAVGLH